MKIEYKKGQDINGIIFIKEADPYYNPASKKYIRKALFKCYCGKEFESVIAKVKSGHTKSCGCRNISVAKELSTTHGLSNHILYSIWTNIKNRCLNPKCNAYKNYGARGITICDKWKNDFKAFYDYLTSLNSYIESGIGHKLLTVDRIDNNGNYEPGNVRFATKHIQATNSRRISRFGTDYLGVSFRKDIAKYRSRITIYGNKIDLGSFIWPEDAYMARIRYILDNNLSEYL